MKTAITPTKVTVTTAADATKILREFVRNADFSKTSFYTIGSKAKWFSVAQIVSWYRTNMNTVLDPGWLGRSLNSAASTGLAVSVNTTTSGTRSISVYRNVRS